MSRVALITGADVAKIIIADLEFAKSLGYDHVEPCDDTVTEGDKWDGKAFSRPAGPDAPPPPEPVDTTFVSVPRFVASFGFDAAVQIAKARAYVPPDPNVDDPRANLKYALDHLFGLLGYLNAERKDVDVADPSVVTAIGYLESVHFIDEAKAAEIKRGVLVQPA